MEITIHPKAKEWIKKKRVDSLIIHRICSGHCCGGAMELVADIGRPERLKNMKTIILDDLCIYIPQTIYDRAERLTIQRRGFSIFTDLVVYGYNCLR